MIKHYLWMIGLVLLAFACGSNKQVAGDEQSQDNLAKSGATTSSNKVPACILKMIDSSNKLDPALQFTEVRRFVYNGSKVYLVSAPCCDQFNPVYDSACNYPFAPSGGFTGKGDGSHTDFFTEAKEDSLIWKKEEK